MRELPDTKGHRAVGIDFGGTSVKIAVLPDFLAEGARDPVVLPTADYPSVDALIGAMADTVRALCAEHDNIAAVGCGVPGLVDFDSGHVHDVTNVVGWSDVPLSELLSAKTGLPVLVDNDANCMAYAEWRYGAARGYRNVVALTLGTGIGGGLIIDGKLYRGSRFAAGELGQMSIDYQGRIGPYGQPGCIEAYMGNRQIGELAAARMFEREAPDGGWTPKAVAELAAAGDAVACDIWVEIADWLGSLLASTAWLLNPDAFVIGGGVSKAAGLLFEPLERRVRSLVSEVVSDGLRILPAQFGNEAGIVGSAAQALDSLE
jgi:glucokinase